MYGGSLEKASDLHESPEHHRHRTKSFGESDFAHHNMRVKKVRIGKREQRFKAATKKRAIRLSFLCKLHAQTSTLWTLCAALNESYPISLRPSGLTDWIFIVTNRKRYEVTCD